MVRFVLAIVIVLLGSAASAENWLSRLFGGEPAQIKLECGIRDQDCLMDAAVDLLALRLEYRENPNNWSPYAKEGQRLLAMVSDEQDRNRYIANLDVGNPPEDFFQTLNAPLNRDTSWITEDLVRSDFDALNSSVKGDFEFYANYALETLLEREPDVAMAIWWDYLDMLQAESIDAIETGFTWLLENDPEGLTTYMESYAPPDSASYDVHELMAYDATQACRFGESDRGNVILTHLDQMTADQRQTANLGDGFFVIDYAPSVEATLYCQGEAEAFERLDDLLALTERAVERLQESSMNEQEKAFSIGVVRSEVGEGSTVPLALWLHRQGRLDEAKKTLARMPYYGTSTTIGGIAENGILSLEAMTGMLNDVVSFYGDNDSYSSDPNIVLDWFEREYGEDDFTRCCVQEDVLERILESAQKLRPEPKAEAAASRVFEYLGRLRENGDIELYEWHEIEVNFARAEREDLGCKVSEDTLQNWLESVRSYPDLVEFQYVKSAYPGDWHQSMVLEAYLQYLHSSVADGSGPCIIQ